MCVFFQHSDGTFNFDTKNVKDFETGKPVCCFLLVLPEVCLCERRVNQFKINIHQVAIIRKNPAGIICLFHTQRIPVYTNY